VPPKLHDVFLYSIASTPPRPGLTSRLGVGIMGLSDVCFWR